MIKKDEQLLPNVQILFIRIGDDYNGESEEEEENEVPIVPLDDYYASICFRFRGTLTRLDLKINNNFRQLERYGEFYQYLSLFPKLQDLNCTQEATIDVFMGFNEPSVMDIHTPMLLQSNKNLDSIFIDGACQFITITTDANMSTDSSYDDNNNKCRKMESIAVVNLLAMDTGTMAYITKRLTLQEFKTRPFTVPGYNPYATTDIICKPNENSQAVMDQFEKYIKNTVKRAGVALKYGDYTFYHPLKPVKKQGEEGTRNRLSGIDLNYLSFF